MFYQYNQNNSGGSFDFDEDAGITHFVIIEADTAREADAKAENVGIYFDGCDSGRDCSCCGDRWYSASDDGDAEPTVYGKPVAQAESFNAWMKEGKEIAVHYKDGRIEWYGIKTELTKVG